MTKSALGAAKHEEYIVLKKLLATGVCQIYMMSRLGCFLNCSTQKAPAKLSSWENKTIAVNFIQSL